MVLIALLGCKDPLPTGQGGLLDQGDLWPYPSVQLMEDGQVRIPDGLMPEVDTPMPVDRLDHREGFSRIQTSLVRLEDIDLDALPSADLPERSGSVQIVDLDTGERVLAFAEVDSTPGADGRLLFVRPMEPMTGGHTMAIVVTTEAAPRPEAFQYVLDGGEFEGHDELGKRTRDLLDDLEVLGVAEKDVAVAWDFPVQDGRASLKKMLAERGPVQGHEWIKIDTAESLPEGIAKRLQGTMTVDSWLVDDTLPELDADGMPIHNGTANADLYVHIPSSAMDAEPGTVPIIIWGHGLFNHPVQLFNDTTDPSHFIELSERLGMIVVATPYRGLMRKDLPDVIWVANDIGRFPEIPERLAQGVSNHVSLVEYVQAEDGLLADDELLGLGNPDEIYYLGVSAGAIMGGVTVANIPELEHSVLHVGGGVWSMTFPRSANWDEFEELVSNGISDSTYRQLSYAMVQMYWDPVDPVNWGAELSDRSVLLQETVDDDEVSNLGTEVLARAAGWPLMKPFSVLPEDIETVRDPGTGPLLVQFAPGFEDPTNGNRPSSRTGAHREVRTWESSKLQILTYLDPADPGRVEHFCGAEVCDSDNDLD
ncbi:MAG: hypothetical protein GY913_25210 [Proteobacteria bacterium]|nr:hypothetical protein [Pseudomonadota bacterium]MCP4920213.1 hypothetical protein [Pseudomonadota bacterium]